MRNYPCVTTSPIGMSFLVPPGARGLDWGDPRCEDRHPMEATPGSGAKRGPGRPRSDPEPRRARLLAAQLVHQVVHLAAMRVCDGKDPNATLDVLRADLHELVPLERLSLSEWLSLELRIRKDR